MAHRFSDRQLDREVKVLVRAAEPCIWKAFGIPAGNSGRAKLNWAKKTQLVAIIRLAEILDKVAADAHAVLNNRQQNQDENEYYREQSA